MTLWFVLTAMIAVAAVFAAAPFIRGRERRRLEADKSVAIYRDQLKEIDAEAAQGALDPAQAEAARTEIKRRALAIGIDADATWSPLSSSERTFAAVSVAAIVAIGSAILFSMTADIETAMRVSNGPSELSAQVSEQPMQSAPAQTAGAGSTPTAAAPAASKSLPSVNELVKRLEDRLQQNPRDIEGWRMLGWSYFSLSRYDEAGKAYGKAVELDPNSAEYRDGQIESLVRAANGTVTADAKAAVDEELKRHPSDPRALFVMGLSLDQSGDHDGALKVWAELKSSLDPNDPWAKEAAKKLSGGSEDSSAFGAASANAAPSAPTPGPAAPVGGKGPTAEDMRAAQAMSSGDRATMIQGMVNSLADRLQKSPRDAEGWMKLIRSWMVLGERDKARSALNNALKAFSDDPEQSQKLIAAAEASGLKQ